MTVVLDPSNLFLYHENQNVPMDDELDLMMKSDDISYVVGAGFLSGLLGIGKMLLPLAKPLLGAMLPSLFEKLKGKTKKLQSRIPQKLKDALPVLLDAVQQLRDPDVVVPPEGPSVWGSFDVLPQLAQGGGYGSTPDSVSGNIGQAAYFDSPQQYTNYGGAPPRRGVMPRLTGKKSIKKKIGRTLKPQNINFI